MTTSYSPFDPAQVDDHFGALASLRSEDPVAEVLPGVFYVARRQDIVAVARDHATFLQGGFDPLAEDHRPMDRRELGETDPPFHTVVRRNLAPFFSPRKMQGYAPLIRQACQELIGDFPPAGPFDLIETFAAPLPAQVIGRLSGIPRQDLPSVRGYSDDFIFAKVNEGTKEAEAAAARCSAFDEHLRQVIAHRRAQDERPDDLLTTLLECQDQEGQPISDERILTHLSKDVLIGGVETTTHFLGNLFYQVLSAPGLYQELRADRSGIEGAVEESLRHLAPVQVVFRRAANDAVVAGTQIPQGSVVVLGLSSGNRDEDMWSCPERFDARRGESSRRHVAFSGGIHLCVGAPLARLEAAVALDTMLDRVARLHVAPGFSYQRVQFFMMRGPQRLDVVAG